MINSLLKSFEKKKFPGKDDRESSSPRFNGMKFFFIENLIISEHCVKSPMSVLSSSGRHSRALQALLIMVIRASAVS